MIVARLPDLLRDQLFDAHDQHVLIVRAIENADESALWRVVVDAPQEIVGQLFLGRHAEAEHVAALRVKAVHHVADRAVLAPSVHGLEDDQQGVLSLGVHQLLQVGHAPQVTLQLVAGLRLLHAPGIVRIVCGEIDLRTYGDGRCFESEPLCVFHLRFL